MPEGGFDAPILINISWRARNRTKTDNEDAILGDCTVMIVFACFFIEANLNYIIDYINKRKEMLDFWGYKETKNIGMQDMLVWYHHTFGTDPKIEIIGKLKDSNDKKNELYKLVKERYEGFSELYAFRNDIAHGKINSSLAKIDKAEILRLQAKKVVNDLFVLAELAGFSIPRETKFDEANAYHTQKNDYEQD